MNYQAPVGASVNEAGEAPRRLAIVRTAGHGAPVRFRLARQLGCKNTKYLSRITMIDNMEAANDPARRGPWYGGI